MVSGAGRMPAYRQGGKVAQDRTEGREQAERQDRVTGEGWGDRIRKGVRSLRIDLRRLYADPASPLIAALRA